MATYAKNKKHIYAWREKNADKNREVNRIAKRRHDLWIKIQKVFLGILLV
jgi:hypothetical protein